MPRSLIEFFRDHFRFDPVMPAWVLIVSALIVAVLIHYLYSAQRQIASRKIVGWLTLIRVTLIVLLGMLLLRPLLTWTATTKTPETLWILLDQSKSMAQADKQATPLERLRWADALGLMPVETRPAKLDRADARLEALDRDLRHLQLQKATGADEAETNRLAQERIDALGNWSANFTSVVGQLEKEPPFQSGDNATLVHDLRTEADQWSAVLPKEVHHGERTASLLEWTANVLALLGVVAFVAGLVLVMAFTGIRKLGFVSMGLGAAVTVASIAVAYVLVPKAEKEAPPVIAEADLPWNKTDTTLQSAQKKAHELADASDNDFLVHHQADPTVKDALEKVGQMRRADIAYSLLTAKSRDLPKSLLDVLEHQNTRVVSFAGGQLIVAAGKGEIPKAIKAGIEPSGTLTDLDDTLKFIADQTDPGERATAVVVSDGRTNDGGDPADAAKTLGSRGVRVFTLALGTRELARDAAIESVDAPEWIYKDDTLTVNAKVRLDNLAGEPATVTFLLGDTVIDSQVVTDPGNMQRVNGKDVAIKHYSKNLTFKHKPAAPGIYGYTIRVQNMRDEVTLENNSRTFRVAVKDDKINVILVQDQPRWEDRYIANYLKRDRRVRLQQVLREPASLPGVKPVNPVKASVNNKTPSGEDRVEAQLLPENAEEWSAFDMIVLGDVPPDFLTPDQQDNIIKAVTKRGAVLLVMAGPFNMPAKFNDKPLADLLPVRPDSKWSDADLKRHLKNGFRLEIAPEGVNNILTRLDVNDDTNARYRAALDISEPIGYWHSEQTQAKALATVLWRIKEVNERPDDVVDPLAVARERALLAVMPAGYGRVVYLSGDSLWRMRYINVPEVAATAASPKLPEVGVNLADHFWGQLVRWVAQNDLPAGGTLVRFGTSKPRYIDGDPVDVTIRLLSKSDLTPLKGQTFKVVARKVILDPVTGQAKGGDLLTSTDAFENAESPGIYHATLAGIKPGAFEISLQGAVVEKMLNEDPLATQKTILTDMLSGTDREMQNVNADPVAMARIAQSSNGIAADIGYADVVAQHIPNLDLPIKTVHIMGLFADPENPYTKKAHWGFLVLFVVLITTEWILRKAGGLV